MNNNIKIDIDNLLISDELILSTKNNFNKSTKNNKIVIYDDLKNKINTNPNINLIDSSPSDNYLVLNNKFDYDNWNKYLSKKKYNFEYIIYKNKLSKYFSFYNKNQKNTIKNKLEDINILNSLSKPFDLDQNNLILNELNLQPINNIKKIKLKDIEIITYFLYFFDSSQIEKIHWSYFSLEYFFIFF